jgi:uncharacterized protein YbjQ (UPF0145 family)
MAIPVTTANEIPGKKIETILGLVFGAGNVAFGFSTSKKAGGAMNKAEESIANEAIALGANAVIGVQMSVDGAGGALSRAQTVTLLGTAVRVI